MNVLAVTQGSDVPTPTWLNVLIAAIAMIGGIGGPLGVAWFNLRRIKNTVGIPNGQGNVVQMQEKILEHVATISTTLLDHTQMDQRFMDDMRDYIKSNDTHRDVQDQRLSALEKRLGQAS